MSPTHGVAQSGQLWFLFLLGFSKNAQTYTPLTVTGKNLQCGIWTNFVLYTSRQMEMTNRYVRWMYSWLTDPFVEVQRNTQRPTDPPNFWCPLDCCGWCKGDRWNCRPKLLSQEAHWGARSCCSSSKDYYTCKGHNKILSQVEHALTLVCDKIITIATIDAAQGKCPTLPKSREPVAAAFNNDSWGDISRAFTKAMAKVAWSTHQFEKIENTAKTFSRGAVKFICDLCSKWYD